MQRRVSAGRLNRAPIVLHTNERFDGIRQFNSKKSHAAKQVQQVPRAALPQEFADGLQKLRQQGKVVLKE